jgi:NAD(P)-dependent dehydrogenase (short-subunit alcohol dehydrogenase family)
MGRYLLTGAGSGIGKAIAAELRPFHDIEFFVETGDERDELRDSGAADSTILVVDLADRNSLSGALGGLKGQLDGNVLAHSFFAMEAVHNFDFDEFDKSFAINVAATNFILRSSAEALLRPQSSSVVVTSTEAYVGSFGASAYAAGKAAVHSLLKTLANVYGGLGHRFNAVAPGWIGGVMDTDTVFEMSRSITPLGRLGLTTEVASVVAFLLSPAAGFINGTAVVTDGGYLNVDQIAKYEFDSSAS